MSSPGFNAGGGAGSSEFFSGRSQNTINNLITTTNHHLLPSLYRTQQQPLPPIFLDPSSQIQQNRFIGKRTLAEFQTQQQNHSFNNLNLVNNTNNNVNFNNSHVLSNLLLRSVKPRTTTTTTSTTNFQFHANNNNTHNTPLSFSLPELQQYPYHQTQRLGVPLLHQSTINPNFHHYRNSNSNLSQITNPIQTVQTVQTIPVSGKVEENNVNNNNNNDHALLQELEKQLLEDNDEEGETETASVITTSEWSETYQNLIGPGLGPGPGKAQAQAQKLVSSSPTSSTTSSTSSSAASPASVCSKQTLIEAANAISEGKNDVALEILNRLVQNLNLNSMNSDQRLANFMVRALKSRMNPVENPPVVAELFGREHAESTQLLLENSVCFKVGFMAANLAILEAAFEENGNSFCVVDFEIGQGKQYVNLLHALKAREVAREGFKLKVVAVAENGGDDRVIAVGEMLRLQAEKLRIGFEFRVVSVSQRQVYELTRELLGCDVEETVIVNFAYKLNRIPDESVSTENPRDTLLRRVKTLAPRVVVIVEQEMNCNTAPFLARVAESWGYYSALCDSVEENSDRVKIEEGVSRKLGNLVACEGRDRVERCEVFGKWRARMSMAGFKMKPMSQNVAESIKSRLNIGNNESRVNSGLSVKEENGGICFGWMGRTLTVASAFSFASTNEVTILLSWTHTASTKFPSSFSNWNPLDSNPCKWSFITCSSQNFVTEINIQNVQPALPFPSNISSLSSLQKLVISGANLTGTIPHEIGNCLNLITIDLSSNSLVGEIPSSIGNLKNLQNLILNSNQLTGSIPIELGDCVNLKNLDIFDNNLSGNLPIELGKLSNLEVIRAGGNKDIVGKIPEELGECKNLTVLGLADTKISGSLPNSLGKLTMLQTISIYSTSISGEIPHEIGNCSELVNLFLYENDLSGEIPFEIGKLMKLEKILLWQNSFVGSIPEEIGNCSSLKILDFSLNYFSGGIPKSLGKLSNLEELMLSNNNISGSIPASISNLTNLIQLQLDTNEISGLIPVEIGKLTKLAVFFAWQNKLEGRIPSELGDCVSLEALDLSYNSLSDSLPSGLFKLQNLTKLLLISNDISGSIPHEIGNCSSLIRLRLLDNRISGEIPREIGFLNNLNFLDLSENHLSGSMPLEIGNCKELQMLNLSNNSLSGDLHSFLSSLTMLEVLDVSMNNFSGEVPMSIGQLTSLLRVILSKNSFSGSIPSSLGKCSGIQLLDLSSNMLSGSIPRELFQIEALDIALNLSHNALSGVIPEEISALNKLSVLDLSHNNLGGDLMVFSGLENLVALNISYNKFTGYLPDSKLFHQLAATDLVGNQGLCPNGHDSCFIGNAAMTRMLNRSNSKRSEIIKVAIGLLSSLTVVMAIFGVVTVFRARKLVRDDNDSEMGGGGGDSWPWQFTPFQKVNFCVEQILKCLVESNVIGKGCSGIVYRAEMENGDVIAVKRLWPTTTAATATAARYNHSQSDKLAVNGGVRDSFSAEVKTLGSIRHKNIVRFLGCCWNRNTRLLMYDYMPNGSLGSLLHEGSGNCLEWHIRFKIILGAAQGVAYLHHDCAPPIVHRDIKANNILIGLEFEPYIADFGLAKLVDDGDFARSSSTLAGSYGYIAPEYGYMMKITEKSDVYSYGIVVLEVLTGKQPIDPTIPDGLHIVDWVRQKRGGVEVLDESLRARPESEIEEMLQTLGVALLCVTPSPDDRPTMKDVVAMMKEIKQERDECVKVFDGSSTNDQHESNRSNEEQVEGMKHSCPTSSSSNTNMKLHYSSNSSTTLK